MKELLYKDPVRLKPRSPQLKVRKYTDLPSVRIPPSLSGGGRFSARTPRKSFVPSYPTFQVAPPYLTPLVGHSFGKTNDYVVCSGPYTEKRVV